jgi:hypothetical protein
VGDAGSSSTWQVMSSAAVMNPWLTWSWRCPYVISKGIQPCCVIVGEGKRSNAL